jgi:hypothetical protein
VPAGAAKRRSRIAFPIAPNTASMMRTGTIVEVVP